MWTLLFQSISQILQIVTIQKCLLLYSAHYRSRWCLDVGSCPIICFRNECFAGKSTGLFAADMVTLLEWLFFLNVQICACPGQGFLLSGVHPQPFSVSTYQQGKSQTSPFFSLHNLYGQGTDILLSVEPSTVLFKVPSQDFSPFITYPSTQRPIQSLKISS